MRNTRNWLVFLLCAMMLVNTLGISAMAAQSESPIALSFSNAADGNVQVQILATEAQTVADGKLVVTYDAEKLTYVNTEAWSDQVTLSVNPQSGKVILAFASADAAPVGTLFTLTFSAESYDTVVAIDGSSYITGVTAGLAQEITVCPSAQFTDLSGLSNEAHAAVDFMVAQGYMNGMTQTTFGPRMNLDRGMMVTILYRIAGKPEVEGDPTFTDVPTGRYFTAPVVWAADNDITKGISANLFAPDKSLTRQELVTFLYRFAKYMEYDVTKTTDLSAYTDFARVQPYAVEAFQWAVASGVVNGTSETTLSPENTTTRAQICIMVSRLLTAQD
jgi:hypothetical protein